MLLSRKKIAPQAGETHALHRHPSRADALGHEDSSRRRSTRTSTSGRGRRVPRARGVQEGRPARPARRRQARGVRRHGPRLLVPDGGQRGARHLRVRRDPDGDRRADRHGDAGARALGHRRAARRSSSPRRSPARSVASIAVSEVRRRLRRRRAQDHRAQGRQRLRDQRLEDVDHERGAGRLAVPARQHQRRARSTREQDARDRADQDQGRRDRPEDRQARHARVATPARSSSRTCACRSATASARRAWAS